MKKIALIGNPVSHSLSPMLFSAAYGKERLKLSDFASNGKSIEVDIEGESYVYEIIESNSVEEAMDKLNSGGYIGANVTAPYKELVMKYVTHSSPVAEIIGAANLIIFKGNEVHAYNTDYKAAAKIIQNIVSRDCFQSEEIRTEFSFYVVGCGGAGKAAASACCNVLKSNLRESGTAAVIANRTLFKAAEYAERLKSSGAQITALSLDEAAKTFLSDTCKNKVLFYTLPCATEFSKQIAAEVVKDERIAEEKDGRIAEENWWIIEPNYLDPAFKKCADAAADKISYIGGLEWLIEQAVYGFEIFTGAAPERDRMISALDL